LPDEGTSEEEDSTDSSGDDAGQVDTEPPHSLYERMKQSKSRLGIGGLRTQNKEKARNPRQSSHNTLKKSGICVWDSTQELLSNWFRELLHHPSKVF